MVGYDRKMGHCYVQKLQKGEILILQIYKYIQLENDRKILLVYK